MENPLFELHLTEEQYCELAQFWHEFSVLGPRRDEIGLDLAGIALSFSEWMDADEDEPRYGIPEILAFFAEKERREGTAFKQDEAEAERREREEYQIALREGGYYACFPEKDK